MKLNTSLKVGKTRGLMITKVKNTRLSRWDEEEEAGVSEFDFEENLEEEELLEGDEGEGEAIE